MTDKVKWDAPVDTVDPDRLWRHAEAFSTSVRASGSPAEAAAFDYAEQVLEQFGYSTRLVRHDAYISLPVRGTLQVQGQSLSCITHAMSVHKPEGVTAPLRQVTPSADLKGFIALANGLANPEAVQDLQVRGAVAAIFINAEHTYEMIVSPVWGSPTDKALPQLPSIPVASVPQDHREALMAAENERNAVRLATEVDTGWRTIPLLEATLKAPRSNGDFVMFSGHIDAWHFGAMDNGGANATMLEVAAVMASHRHELARDLRLLFWSGHSHGRYAGSTWYADHHYRLLHDHCVLHINIDSVGGRGATVLTEAPCMPETLELAKRAIKAEAGVEYIGTRFPRAGDQSFWGTGTPSVFMGLSEQPPSNDEASQQFTAMFGGKAIGFGWWWHTPEDTLDKLDPELLLRDCRIYLRVVHEACTSAIMPLRFSRTAREIQQHLIKYADLAGEEVDFSEALAFARQLVKNLEKLDARLDEMDTSAANDLLKALGQVLIPLNYVSGSRFEHDPALPQPPIPCLAKALSTPKITDESVRKRCQIELRRALNRVELSLRDAGQIAEKAG